MSNYTQKEGQLLKKLYFLTVMRSLRPSMRDNLHMRLCLEELYLLTEKEKYKL